MYKEKVTVEIGNYNIFHCIGKKVSYLIYQHKLSVTSICGETKDSLLDATVIFLVFETYDITLFRLHTPY